ncbi:MAG: PIG-L family deacetylase [Planctomycetes bacterium]|nr:PIG-L family deacetylase [Planctomycetota bacterium]
MVAANPDDEVLGCGDTLVRHVAAGDDVHILIMAAGVTSRDPTPDAEGRADELEALRDAARAAADTLGLRPPRFAGLPDNRIDALYDHIRMLDAETYPKAFLDHGEFRLEFSHAEMSGDELKARVVIRRRDGGQDYPEK